MTDLETRLRAHAQQPMTAPDFDDAFRAARDGEPAAPARGRPGRLLPWLAAAAAVVLVAGGATALGVAEGHDSGTGAVNRQATSGSSTAPFTPTIVGVIVSDTHTAVGTIAKDNHLRISKGGFEFLVFVTSPTSTEGKDCVGIPGLQVVETSTQVRIRVTAPRLVKGMMPCATAGFPDPPGTALLAGLEVGIPHLVGNRAVVDDQTGEPVKVFDPTYPHATYLPAGYSELDPNAIGAVARSWTDARPGFLAPLAVAQPFGPLNSAPGRPPLVVVQSPYDTVNPGATIVDHVTINGHDATVTDSADVRCVTWSPDGHGGMQVCSDTTHPLSESELVRMARGLR